jgi:hypothetical protein
MFDLLDLEKPSPQGLLQYQSLDSELIKENSKSEARNSKQSRQGGTSDQNSKKPLTSNNKCHSFILTFKH